MKAEVYWVTGVWPGKLGLAPRPRGGDWLDDEVADWKRQDTAKVVSLLMADEERDLNLKAESSDVQNIGMEFISLPILDRGVPPSRVDFDETISAIEADLNARKKRCGALQAGSWPDRLGRGMPYGVKGLGAAGGNR